MIYRSTRLDCLSWFFITTYNIIFHSTNKSLYDMLILLPKNYNIYVVLLIIFIFNYVGLVMVDIVIQLVKIRRHAFQYKRLLVTLVFVADAVLGFQGRVLLVAAAWRLSSLIESLTESSWMSWQPILVNYYMILNSYTTGDNSSPKQASLYMELSAPWADNFKLSKLK